MRQSLIPKKIMMCVLIVISLSSAIVYGSEFPSPEEADDFDISILTVGLGEPIEARYGHTILRFSSKKSSRNFNINWGMFDFSDPYLPLNFFLGRLRYWVTQDSYENLIYRYRSIEKRPVFLDHLNLSLSQKKDLIGLVKESLKPENKYFWYQYFYKNCSTIPRDLLDQVLGGRLKSHFTKHPSSRSFRDYVRINLNKPPVVGFFLDIVMNSRLDGDMSQWKEMFYPAKLREYLLGFEALSELENVPVEDSVRVNGAILIEGRKIVDHNDVPSSTQNFHMYFFSIQITILVAFALLFKFSKFRSTSLRLYGVLLSFWGIFSGFLGFVMLISWIFSDHLDLHHNANLLLLWPIDLVFVVLGFSLIRRGAVCQKISKFTTATCFIAKAHLSILFAFFLFYLLDFVTQNCGLVMTYIAPIGVLHYLTILFLYRSPRGLTHAT